MIAAVAIAPSEPNLHALLSGDPRTLGQRVVDLTRRLLGADVARFAVPCERGELRTVFSSGLRSVSFDADDLQAQLAAARSREAMPFAVDGRVARIVCPIVWNERLLGVLDVLRADGGPGFTRRDLAQIRAIAGETASCIGAFVYG